MPASFLECIDYVHSVKFILLIAFINYSPSRPRYWFTSYHFGPLVGKFMSQLLVHEACNNAFLGITCTAIDDRGPLGCLENQIRPAKTPN